MKNKFLSKMMMIALVICSMFLISACSLQKNVNIESISIDQSSIPEFIRVGEFDAAKIELIVNYDNGSTEEVFVTTSMLSEESREYLQTPGIYEVEIFFKGEKTTLNITIVQESIYLVEFYNGNQQLIERQFVEKHSDAIAPMESAYAMFGYDFVGWDRLFTDVTEDIKVYGIYSKITAEDMNARIHEKMVNAFTYMYTNDYVATAVGFDAQIVYHSALTASGEPVSQVVQYENDKIEVVANYSRTKISEYWNNPETGEWLVETENLLDGENATLTDEERNFIVMTCGGEGLGILFDENSIFTYDYTLTESRNIYTVEITPADNGEDFSEKIVLTFDDEKMLSYKSVLEGSDDDFVFELLIDYRTGDFVTINNQNLFLMLYNEARENVLAQTTLRQEEIEARENGHCFYRNFKDNEAYIYSTHPDNQSREDWIQNEDGVWYEYSRYTDTESLGKSDISSKIVNNNLIETYIGSTSLLKYEELINEFNITFNTYFSGDTIVLIANVIVENEVVMMKYNIENNLVTKVEDFSQDLTWNFIYDADNIVMPELPTVSE